MRTPLHSRPKGDASCPYQPNSHRLTRREEKSLLIEHHFDNPVLQADFEALTNNEDRLDYIEGIEGIAHLEQEALLSHEEVLNALGMK